MTLPPPIVIYFTAEDGDTFAKAFTQDAEVLDEGQTHHGPEAIRAWWQAAKAKYRHRAEPLDMTEANGKTVVSAKVSGDFPGSPIVLRFSFGLQGALIRELGIGA
jgi:hypothetical protein